MWHWLPHVSHFHIYWTSWVMAVKVCNSNKPNENGGLVQSKPPKPPFFTKTKNVKNIYFSSRFIFRLFITISINEYSKKCSSTHYPNPKIMMIMQTKFRNNRISYVGNDNHGDIFPYTFYTRRRRRRWRKITMFLLRKTGFGMPTYPRDRVFTVSLRCKQVWHHSSLTCS